MIRVFIADDQGLFAESLKLFLQQDPEIEVAGTATTGKETIEAMGETQPDVLLLNSCLPDMPGLETAQSIRIKYPEVRILILTAVQNEDDMLSYFCIGISGYIIKDIKPPELSLAVKSVFYDLFIMHPEIHSVIRKYVEKDLAHHVAMAKGVDFSSLTIQEQKIVKLLAEGKSNKEISDLLSYTEGTVKNYISRIFQKTGCRDRLHIAIQALKQELS